MKRIIVCTNTWFEELERLSPAERHWLETNSVVVKVENKLYLEQQQSGSAINNQDEPMDTMDFLGNMEFGCDDTLVNGGPIARDGCDVS